jgi:hypothetical protein
VNLRKNALRLSIVTLGLLLAFSVGLNAEVLTLTTLPTHTQGGYYVGPTGSNFGPVVCTDYNISTNVPGSYNVNVVSLTSMTDLKIGYLFEKMLTAPDSQIGDLQYAIWELKNSSFSKSTTGMLAFINEANHATLTQGMFSDLRFFVPSDSCNQTFIGYAKVPEPLTWGMMGFGLLGIGLMRRKKQTAA